MNKIKHINAKTLDEAVRALSATANVNAGGTDLYGTLKSMCLPKPPETIINLKTIPGLDYIKEEGGMLKLGPLATLTAIAESPVVRGKWASLADAAGRVASPALRNMGTIAGNLCQRSRCWYYRAEHDAFLCFRKGGETCFGIAGDNRYLAIMGGQLCFQSFPSDTAIPLCALDATVVTTQQSIKIRDFFVVLGNKLKENEIIKEITVPAPAAGTKQAFIKWADRKSIDFATASCAVALTGSDAVIYMGAIGPLPIRATTAEDLIKGKAVDATSAQAAADEALKRAVPQSMNRHKIQIAKTIVKRTLLAAK
jgi:xanthine dehydrogenase YagS FAD-binding subunit